VIEMLLMLLDRRPKVFPLRFGKEAGCCSRFENAPGMVDMRSGLGRKYQYESVDIKCSFVCCNKAPQAVNVFFFPFHHWHVRISCSLATHLRGVYTSTFLVSTMIPSTSRMGPMLNSSSLFHAMVGVMRVVSIGPGKL
jgi:hypothetical protein